MQRERVSERGWRKQALSTEKICCCCEERGGEGIKRVGWWVNILCGSCPVDFGGGGGIRMRRVTQAGGEGEKGRGTNKR